MPYTGEHSARINPPSKYEKLRRQNNKFGAGIHAIFGMLKEGGSEVQALRFDADKFTTDEAKSWLKEHDYKLIEFEPAAEQDEDKKEQELSSENRRYLAVALKPAANIQEVDGGLLVPGVKLLAPGTWTDSTQKTPCRYTTEILERYHANWTDLSYWSRHSGGTPRDITDRIADIKNIRYHDGVIADLFFHGATTKSQDSISLLKAAAAGKVPWPYSSVEMMTRDRWIVSEKLYEAQEVLFDGAAMVNQGACRTCKIRNNEDGNITEGKPDETPSYYLEKTQEDNMAEFDKDAFKVELVKELSAIIKPPEAPKMEIPKELAELPEIVKALSSRLEKIEKAPEDPKTKGVDGSEPKELGLPEYFVPVNRKTGTIGGGD